MDVYDNEFLILKKEKPTDGEIQVSYHTKPPCLLAISVDKES